MTSLMLAIMVGMLFATGAYLLLRRHPIKLLLGLSLLSYGVNLLLFSTGSLERGLPPIIKDKEALITQVGPFVDPIPQALILTAIVISFGVTAFVVVLIYQRNRLGQARAREMPAAEGGAPIEVVGDPFAANSIYLSDQDDDPEDYVWLEYSLADERRQAQQAQPTERSD